MLSILTEYNKQVDFVINRLIDGEKVKLKEEQDLARGGGEYPKKRLANYINTYEIIFFSKSIVLF